MALSERYEEALNAMDVRVLQSEESDGASVDLNWCSPAGEDFWVSIYFDGTDAGFVAELKNYAGNFDPDEHAEMWIPSRGRHGVPSSIREIVEDAEQIKRFLLTLSENMEKLLPKV